MKSTSSYLFLQGQISPFFAELGRALRERGHPVHRINFNGGDRLFWTLPDAVDFRGREDQWPEFLAAKLRDWQISDLVLFGDCRPLHATAIRVSAALGVQARVFEEGYLRPDYITLETGGVNGHSGLPRDPQEILRLAAAMPEMQAPASIPASFARRAWEDCQYHVASLTAIARFPHHRSHRPWHPLREYAIGAYRLPAKTLNRRDNRRKIRDLLSADRPYYLFPLQLAADSQIRFHSGSSLPELIGSTIRSFARFAPADSTLVLTEHPLDYGPVNLIDIAVRAAHSAGIADRVLCLRDGSPLELVRAARAIITVNSTLGISAMEVGVPVIALGRAIYGLPGLSFQGDLDTFWAAPMPPEPALFAAFRRVVAARTQINGGFFSAEGIATAVAGALKRLPTEAESILLTPPRQHMSEREQTASPALWSPGI